MKKIETPKYVSDTLAEQLQKYLDKQKEAPNGNQPS